MRDPETIDQARRDERQNRYLWKGTLGLAAAAAVLLVGEGVLGASRGYLSLQRGWNEERQPLVQSIDQLQTTTNTLRQFQDSNLEPFAMIDAMWPYQRWPDIIYRRFESAGPDSLVIDARAGNRTQMAEFKRRLETYEKVRSVDITREDINPAGATFTAIVRFEPGFFFQPPEVARHE